MRFSDGVTKYHNEKKKEILSSVLSSAQALPSGEGHREGIIMSTNNSNLGEARVKTSKSSIIAAACAILMLGGAVTFYALKGKDGSTEIKKSPSDQPVVSTVVNDDSQTDESKTDDSSETPESKAPIVDDGKYPTISPETVIAPDDKGTIVEGFEGYDIEVKYLLEDPWKGIDNYAQHSYGVVVDVKAKEGNELPWADEEPKKFSHFGDMWIDNGHTQFFYLLDAKVVYSYGYKTQNEEGEEVLRFVIAADVNEGSKLDKDTKLSFDINVVYWGEGENFKTEGKFTASVTFDEARALDLALTIPYQSEY